MALIDHPLKIGKTVFPGRLGLAPMAGVTNLPFRRICREHGCRLAFTEMISTEGLLRDNAKTLQMVAHHASELENGSLAIQLFGDDPERLAEGARWVQDHTPVGLLNVNMGCPVDKVTKRNGGASLLKDPALIGRIVAAIKKVARVPVSIKIRAGWDSQTLNYLEVLRMAEENGADTLICHPRTRVQLYSGKANWNIIRDLVAHARIPIFGNGDVFTADDVRNIMQYTGCAGVMVARGANGNPWIFSALEGSDATTGYPTTLQEVGRTLERHLEYAIEFFGEKLGLNLMKKHFIWYSKWRKDGQREFRGTITSGTSLVRAREQIQEYFRMQEMPVPVYPWWLTASTHTEEVEETCSGGEPAAAPCAEN